MPKINKSKVLHLSKLAGKTFVIQGFIQFVGMLVGFLIVRNLSIEEYAYYTIVNQMLTMMNTLSDSGISTSVFALGAKVWQDKVQLGKVLSNGIRFRNKFALISLSVGIPFTGYLLWKQGAPVGVSLLVLASMIPAFKAQLTDNLYEVVPKLHQELDVLQKNQIMVAVGRLFLNGICAILLPFSYIAVLANGVPRLLGNIRLKGIVQKNATFTDEEDPEVKKGIWKIVRRTLPGSFYYAFSEQISLWILSLLGKTANIAAWGALGRYSMLFTIISTFFAMAVVPRYARKEGDRKTLLLMAHRIILLEFLLGGIVLAAIFLFSDKLLLLLGTEYSGLNRELLLISFTAFLQLVMGTCFALTIRRGWIVNPIVDLMLNMIPLAVFAFILPLDSLANILIFNSAVQLSYLLGRYVILLYMLFKNTKAEPNGGVA